MTTDSRLIFDIGANDGTDAEFYLRKGFRVVAAEPNPALCDAMRARLAAFVADGRLAIECLAITDGPGTVTLNVSTYSEWSAIERTAKNSGDMGGGAMLVPTTTLDDLIARHGAPYYIKIDVEGAELAVLSGYGGSDRAVYVSIEQNQRMAACLDRLGALGYGAFCLVEQGRDALAPPPEPAREGSYVPWRFTNASSGVFGRELAGPWLDRAELDAALAEIDTARAGPFQRGEKRAWFDVHARLD